MHSGKPTCVFYSLRSFASAAFFLLLLSQSHGQVGVGIFGGSVATEFSGIRSDVGRFGFEMGYTVGTQLDYYMNKDVTLSMGLAFQDERGSVHLLDDTDPGNTVFKDSFDISIKQLKIPLTFRIITKNERWHFIGGVSADFPLSLKAISKVDFDGGHLLRDFNLGYLTGIGFRFKKKTWGTVHLEMRYAQSLVTLTTPEDPVLSQMKSSHSTFTVVYFPPFLTP